MADKQIKTGGGSSVEGDVDTEGGDFTGRDRIHQSTTTNIFTENHTLGVLAVVAIVAMLILGVIAISARPENTRPGATATTALAAAAGAVAQTPLNAGEPTEIAAAATGTESALILTSTVSASPPAQVQVSEPPTASKLATSAPTSIQMPDDWRIGLNQTVTGTLVFDEGDSWVFRDGPAIIDVTLDLGPEGAALLVVLDAGGVERRYVDGQAQGVARLRNFTVPDDSAYTLFVRNQNNTPTDYTLTVAEAKPPQPIRLGETVTGTLVFDEGDSWVFRDGPAVIDVTLDLGPEGAALLIVLDAEGVERRYVDGQSQGVARLRNFTVPDDSAYTLFVRNQNNTPTDYTLTVQAAGAVENP